MPVTTTAKPSPHHGQGVVAQLAPAVSLLVSAGTLAYVVVTEWRQATADGSGPSPGAFLRRLRTFLSTAAAALLVAGTLHVLLGFVSLDGLALPVWLAAVLVVVMTGATQAMPGDTFEEKLQRADAELRANGPTSTEPPVRERDDGEKGS